MVHVLIAGLGLGAIVASSPWIFDVIRWVGVGYLLWLAYGALSVGPVVQKAQKLNSSQAFREGLLVNLTNPKVILFVLAFIPQFVVPGRGSILVQFLLFGAILSIGGLIVNGAVGIFAGSFGRALTESPRVAKTFSYVTASIYTAIAMRLALIERS